MILHKEVYGGRFDLVIPNETWWHIAWNGNFTGEQVIANSILEAQRQIDEFSISVIDWLRSKFEEDLQGKMWSSYNERILDA